MALELGGMTVGWLKQNMSSYELSQWLAYYELKAERMAKEGLGEGKGVLDEAPVKPTVSNFRALFGKRIKSHGSAD